MDLIILAWINLTAAFLLELLALYILGDWGFHLNAGEAGRWIAGLGTPLIFLTAWSFWAAPHSPRRLRGWNLWFYKAFAFALAALALGADGQTTRAVIFAAAVLVNLVLLRVWQRFEPKKRP